MLFRVSLSMLGNTADAEDAVSETLLTLIRKNISFKDEEHKKAYLITTVRNKCRDILRYRQKYDTSDIDLAKDIPYENSYGEISEILKTIPEKIRVVIILHYIEGYSTEEIAKVIKRTPSAVKMRLKKGREMLREKYRKEYL
ncbi:MAG: RNA polymerase sigma factor [Oscillospiraceae bacterium]|nr:RNA polymerase sigma factor [Oscillospiraceae bacterium]MBR4093227.1 RNA polymerase sigma factor [Oscillospiraceae bacterium]